MLDIKKINFHNGISFFLNNYNFEWRDLEKFFELKKVISLRQQQTLFISNIYTKPTFIKDDADINEPFIPIVKMTVCIACYDEEWSELSGTLRSLSKNILTHHKRPDNSFKLYVTVIIIQDGWNKASKSFKEGIYKEWGIPSEEWINSKLINNNKIGIFIPDNNVYYPSYNYVNKEDKIGVIFTPIFITKIKNCQKHNSHLLFFSICNLQKPDCVFLTDAGTIYDSNCIYKLVEHLYKKRDRVIGVTARQKIMNTDSLKEIKEYPSWWVKQNKGIDLFDKLIWWLSPAPIQGFEFESSFLLSICMFNILGALPVLPGPCQLIWWEYLDIYKTNNVGVLDMYFRHLNMDPQVSGIVKLNTLLAEDRILSFSMILRTYNLKTVWVNGANFSYEPILTWTKLLSQRRRWTNGTIATYLYYLFEEKGKDEFLMSGVGDNKIIQTLWSIQLYQSILQVLSPSFFSIALFEAFLQFSLKYPFLFENISYKFLKATNIYTYVYFCIYLLWVLFSFVFGKKSTCCSERVYICFVEPIHLIFVFINLIVSIFIFYNIIFTKNNMPILITIVLMWSIPFFLSLTISFNSFISYLLYTIPYLCNIIQYVTFIPSFAITRIHDLSWGNRDSTTSYLTIKKKYNLLFESLKINFFVILANFTILSVYQYIVNTFGHIDYLYIIIFSIIFIPIILQYFFIVLSFLKFLYKKISPDYQYKNNGDSQISSISNTTINI